MKKNNLIFLIFSILISSLGILSLFHSGFFLTDDGNSMVIRFSAFYETLRSSQFPVRFLHRLNFGYGYPVSDFLYPLFMYIGVPIKALGFSFVNTIKIIVGFSFLSGTFFSYLWLKKLFDDKSALVGSVAYSLFPYHLFDIYKRGSVGEVLALGIIPFIFWSIEKKNFILISIGYAVLITAHNSLALIFIPIIFIYQILLKIKLVKILLSFFLGFSLSSFFWIPALYDKQFTIFDITTVSNYKDYFVNSEVLTASALLVLLSIIFAVFKIKKNNKLLYFFIILSLLSIFMTLPVSDIFWKFLPLSSLVQFPFRFLSIATFGISFLLSYGVFNYKGKIKSVIIIFILLIILFLAKEFLIPKVFQNYPDTYYSTNQDSTTVKNEYMPKSVKEYPKEMSIHQVEPFKKISFLSGNINNMSFKVSSNKSIIVQVARVYFPGWKASVDGKKVVIKSSNPKGLIEIPVNVGDHIVHVYFEEDGIRLISDFISVISIFILLGIFIKNVKIY